MPENWYQVVQANTPITQGDLISECPVITWAPNQLELDNRDEIEILKAAVTAVKADVVVMTQACDLAQSHIEHVILCPHVSLEEYRNAFEAEMSAKNQNLTPRAWKRQCEDIKDGFVWNLAMLNAEEHDQLRTPHRIVDFKEVFTVPRTFVESLLAQRAQPRLTLLPPYREHLSQAFARFFMRVGLPAAVKVAW